jgi:hypothetical protein
MEPRAVGLVFAPEFNLTMPDADSDRYSIAYGGEENKNGLGAVSEAGPVKTIEVRDGRGELGFSLELSEKCLKAWHVPVKTVSQSEKAYELNYQSSAIVPHFEVKLAPGEEKSVSIEVSIIYSQK